MKTIALAVLVSLGVAAPLLAVGTNQTITIPAVAAGSAAGTNLLADEKARISYAIGMMFAQNFQKQGVEADSDLLARGLKDMQSGGTTLLTEQEMKDTLTGYQKILAAKQQKMREEEQKMRDAAAEKNKADGEAFLAGNKTNSGVVTLPDGLQYLVITNGTGEVPTTNDTVTVAYRGRLIDGTEFDSSFRRHLPTQFPVSRVIRGWTEALTHMKVGSKWQIFVPAELAYGPVGSPPRIEPNSVLIFEMELLFIDHNAPSSSMPHTPLTSDIIKVPSVDEMKKGAKPEIINSQDAAKLQQPQSQPPK